VSEAINASEAAKLYICNLMTKPGESDGFTASTFAKLIQEYLGTTEPLDYLVFNTSPYPERLLQRYAADKQHPIELDIEECRKIVRRVVCRPVLAAGVYLRHDPRALAKTIMEIINNPVEVPEYLPARDGQSLL
jgi:uncharacterized cofD-like protein